MVLEKTLESPLDCKDQPGATHISHTPAACSFPGEKARSWGALGEARPGQSSLSAGSLKLVSIESVMPSSHLILCHPLLLLPSIPPSISIFSNESTLRPRLSPTPHPSH